MSRGLVLNRHGDLSLTPNVQWYIPMLVGLVYGRASPQKICESQWGYFLSNRLNETEKVIYIETTKQQFTIMVISPNWLYSHVSSLYPQCLLEATVIHYINWIPVCWLYIFYEVVYFAVGEIFHCWFLGSILVLAPIPCDSWKKSLLNGVSPCLLVISPMFTGKKQLCEYQFFHP
jgi:hypothetical protein